MLVKRGLGLALSLTFPVVWIASPGGAEEARPSVFSGGTLAAAVSVRFDIPNFLPVSPLFLGGAGRAVGAIGQDPPQTARAAALDFGDIVPTAPGLVELLGVPYPTPLPRDYGQTWMATAAFPERPVEDTKVQAAGGEGQPFSARSLYGHAETTANSSASDTALASFRLLPDAIPEQAATRYHALVMDLRQRLAAVPGVSPAALPAEGGALIEVDQATSSQSVGLEGGALTSAGRTVMQGVKLLGGALRIAQLEASTAGRKTGAEGSGEATGALSGVTLAGQSARLTRDGIQVDDTPLGQGSGDQLEKAFNEALASAGFSLAFDRTAKSGDRGLLEVSWTGISLTQTVADFPPGFSTVYRFDLGTAASRLSIAVPPSEWAPGPAETPAVSTGTGTAAPSSHDVGGTAPSSPNGEGASDVVPPDLGPSGTSPVGSAATEFGPFAGGAGDSLAGLGKPPEDVPDDRGVPEAGLAAPASAGLADRFGVALTARDTRAVSEEVRWAALAALALTVIAMAATARLRASTAPLRSES